MKGVLRDVRFRALRLLAPVFILLFTASILWGTHPAFAAPKISVLVDGRSIAADVPPFIENGRTLVPVRALAESLGAKVIWEERKKTITIEAEGKKVKLQIGNRLASSDGRTTVMEVAPRILQGRAFVPLRFVSEHLGAAVKWDGNTGTARIFKETLRPLVLGTVRKGGFGTLNPRVADWLSQSNIEGVTHVGLVKFTPDLKLAPCLAERWEISPDGKAVTFYLRRNAKWHDGTPVTAEDVKFTYEANLKHHFMTNCNLIWEPFFERAEIKDPWTVTCHFKRPVAYAALLEEAGNYMLPKHIWEDIVATGDPGKAAGRELMIGNGPFIFERYDPAERIAYLKANPDYFAGKPVLNEVRYKIFDTMDQAVLALCKGEIDGLGTYYESVAPAYAEALEKTKGVSLGLTPNTGISFLLQFNVQKYPLNLKEMREAISLALDYNQLVKMFAGGYGEVPGRGFIPPRVPGHNPELSRLAYDPEGAKRILDSLGLVDKNGDGWRDLPTGEKLILALIPYGSPDELYIRMAEVIASYLKNVGLNATLDQEVIGNVDKASKKLHDDKDFWLCVRRAYPMITQVIGGLCHFVDLGKTKEGIGAWGTSDDPQLQELYFKMLYARNEKEALEAIRELQDYYNKTLVGIALSWNELLYPHRIDKYTGWITYPRCPFNYFSWWSLEPAE